ncbi:pyruvyl transferase [Rhodococcus sp. 27YEA15]|uniref:polysaccharide pyruvyl transferase family protein n=1 Tax=Rhodococcus sp. 27YEA15 TaxID=3156259 RepID=UPI003C7BD4EA
MPEVDVLHWNPRKLVAIPGLKRPVRVGSRVDNFGDLLGPRIVSWMSGRTPGTLPRPGRRNRMLAVGSIMHLARNGDTVWGTGVNGKIPADEYEFDTLDVRAVRGPLTREFLQQRGIDSPTVYGDPGLLVPALFPELVTLAANPVRDLTVVPNLNDLPKWFGTEAVLDPTDKMSTCLRTIASSRLVVGSSLHAIVIAESLGIPARLIPSDEESDFKYADYYLGTGRELATAATVAKAVSMGGAPALVWDERRLTAAFPHDLFGR